MIFEYNEPIEYYDTKGKEWLPGTFIAGVTDTICIVHETVNNIPWHCLRKDIRRRDNSIQDDNPNVSFKKRQS